MNADERTRTVVYREWTLPTPAHHTEVDKALAVARQKRNAEPGYPTDIVFTHGDDEIVIGYAVEGEPKRPARECTALCDDIERDRDEWERRAGRLEATVRRVRDLAVEWSAMTGTEAAAWRHASMLLHHALDGPDDEPGADGTGSDDLDEFVREQAEQDPEFASEYVKAQHAAQIRAFEDLLASLSLYIGQHPIKQLTTEQRNLYADSVDASCARLAQADPAYGEPRKVERWWAE